METIRFKMRSLVAIAVGLGFAAIVPHQVVADVSAAKKWVDSEFQPSTLSKEEQLMGLPY